MRISLLILAAALGAAVGVLSNPAVAAPAAAVLGACDRTEGCGYAADSGGNIAGCSKQSGVCFYCPADGKKECIQVRKNPQTGKSQQVRGRGLTDMVTAAPDKPAKSKKPPVTGILGTGPGMSTQGPVATGAPAAPAGGGMIR